MIYDCFKAYIGGCKMDALKVLDKLDQVEVLYEPIYSADQHEIVAYEIIGQIKDGDKIINIEAVTSAVDVPIEIRAEIELIVVKQAIEAMKHELKNIDLYVPCNPDLLMHDIGENFLQMLLETLGEDRLSNVMLVMKEHMYAGDIKSLHHMMRYFKTFGIKVALNDVGSSSQLEHILLLEPTVLKIDINQLNYNRWGARNPVFSTIRSLAFKIGASLLIEKIETSYQLQQGWKTGARYYKGEYLEGPQIGFIEPDTLKERFKKECEQFIATEKKQLEQKYEQLKLLERQILQSVEDIQPNSSQIESMYKLAERFDSFAFRLYICDGEGFQTTSNIVRREGQWIEQAETKGKNWSWRPYYLMNIIKMRNDLKGELSQSYIDIETGELTRTFSMAVKENEYLFIDISYEYLYEHNVVQ